MMIQKIKKEITISIFALGLLLIGVLPAKAQLFNQYKTDESNISYIQFPSQKERKNILSYEMIQENLAGKVAKKVIKNDKIAGALTKKNGVLGNTTESVSEITLIPDIFPTDGNLHAEITYSLEFKNKGFSDLPKEKTNFIAGGEEINVIASFKVRTTDDNKVIYEHEKTFVEGYTQKSSTGSGAVTGSAKAAAKKHIASKWALNKIKAMYGISMENHYFPVYRIKNLDGDLKDQAKNIQDQYVNLLAKWDGRNYSSEFQQEVKKCMAHWEKLMGQYKPGTKKQKNSLITDNNVWCLQHNLAMGYLMLENYNKAIDLINKAVKIRTPEVKDIKNKEGETVGGASGVQNTEDQFLLAKSKRVIENYKAGIENMNSEFVAFLNDKKQIMRAGYLAKETATNMYLSSLYNLNYPVDLINKDFKDNPASITGEVSDDDNTVNFNLKKNFLFFLTRSYSMKMSNEDGLQTKQKLNINYLPSETTFSSFLAYRWDYKNGFASKINFRKAKDAKKRKYITTAQIQYDYNGDILINETTIIDKGLFITYAEVGKGDALGYKKRTIRIKHDNLKINTIDIETKTIERDRSTGLIAAMMEKKIAPDEPLETTIVSEDSSDKEIVLSELDINKTLNDKGSWKNYKIENIEADRSFEY